MTPLIIVVVALVAITVVFTLSIRTKDLPAPEPVSPTQHLEDRKAAIYENLRDLQFEYRLGKLSDEDYAQSKLGLQKELATVLQEIEAINAAGPKPVKKAAPPPANVCPHCGAKFAKAMKFCGECGKAMS